MSLNFDQYKAVPNDREIDEACDQQYRRWGQTYNCTQQAAWIVLLEPGPGFAIMCQEHFTRFHETQNGRGYTYEPFTLERAKEVKAATPLGGE
jgi:hypothetical protein